MAIVTDARQRAFERLIQNLDSTHRMIEADEMMFGAIETAMNTLSLELYQAHGGSETAPMRASFEAGRLAMAFDILAGDVMTSHVRLTAKDGRSLRDSERTNREMLRFYREWFRELPARIDLAALATDNGCQDG